MALKTSNSPWARGAVAVACLGLAGCTATPGGGILGGGAGKSGGFEARYTVARNALETGQYDRARRTYAELIGQAGPFAPRLRLELAHAELRAGNYATAAEIAGSVAKGATGPARGTALAVRGTALHELGDATLAAGRTDRGTALLRAAQAALAEVVKDHPDLDPLGAMAGRHAAITARLGAP